MNEINALKIQLVNAPIDVALARMLFGNISESNTHITTPIDEANKA